MKKEVVEHVSQDGLLKFIIVRDETGDVSLGFENYAWHTHAGILAALSGLSQAAAVERFVRALLDNETIIAVETKDDCISDIWVPDDAFDPACCVANDGVITFRTWDGSPWKPPTPQ